MQKYLLTIVALAAGAGAVYGGFLAGSAFTADHYQRVALSRGFGELDGKTLQFVWAEPIGLNLPASVTK